MTGAFQPNRRKKDSDRPVSSANRVTADPEPPQIFRQAQPKPSLIQVSTPLKSVAKSPGAASTLRSRVATPASRPIPTLLRSEPINGLQAISLGVARSAQGSNPSENPFVSLLPPKFRTHFALKAFEVFDFLLNRRPTDFEPFCRATFDLYSKSFSRSARAAAKVKAQDDVQNGQIPPTTVHPLRSQPTQPSTVANISDTDNPRVSLFKASGPIVDLTLCSKPLDQTKAHINDASRHLNQPDNHSSESVVYQDPQSENQLPAPLGAALSVGNIVNQTSNENTIGEARGFRSFPHKSPDVLEGCSDDELPSKDAMIKPPHITRSMKLDKQLSKRHVTFIETQKSLSATDSDGHSYIVWRATDNEHAQHGIAEVAISVSACLPHQGILDQSNGLSSMCLNVLRFFWFYLVADPCAGSIFSHGLGFPRQHLVFLFAQLLCTTYADYERKKILIMTPDSSLDQWVLVGESFVLPEFKVTRVHPESWYADIKKWRSSGGVLLCSFYDYTNITQHAGEPEKRTEVMADLCNPGPDIVIIDEALNMLQCDCFTLAYLNRIGTKARLGLTSMPIGGNLAPMAAISEWTCPNLFGSEMNFWNQFTKPITEGNRVSSSIGLGEQAYAIARQLWQRFQSFSLLIYPNERREALDSRGKALHESLITLNLAPTEREIYKRASTFLVEATERGDVSCFVALHVLSVATASIFSMMKLLDDVDSFSANFVESIADDGRVKSPTHIFYAEMVEWTEKVFVSFRRLRDLIKPMLVEDEVESRKMSAMKSMVTIFLKNDERIVIFTSCDQLQDEVICKLHEMDLQSGDDDKKRVIFRYDLNAKERNGAKEVRDFNMCKHGAVLVAPYGVGVECIEDSGWSYVNATKVIVLDGIWFVGSIVQALNRVHNFAAKGAFEVDVFYMQALGTVDIALESATLKRYSELERSIELSNKNRDCFPINPVSGYRGYLVEPQLSIGFLNYDPCLDTLESGPPLINRESGKHLPPIRQAWLQNIVTELLKLRSWDDRDIPVAAFAFSVTRYAKYCEILEMVFIKDRGLPDQNLLREIGEDRGDFLGGLQLRLRKVRNAVESCRGNVEGALWNDLNEVDSIYCSAERERNGLFELWKHYFSLYEWGLRRSTDFGPTLNLSGTKDGDESEIREGRRMSNGYGQQRMSNDGIVPGEENANHGEGFQDYKVLGSTEFGREAPDGYIELDKKRDNDSGGNAWDAVVEIPEALQEDGVDQGMHRRRDQSSDDGRWHGQRDQPQKLIYGRHGRSLSPQLSPDHGRKRRRSFDEGSFIRDDVRNRPSSQRMRYRQQFDQYGDDPRQYGYDDDDKHRPDEFRRPSSYESPRDGVERWP